MAKSKRPSLTNPIEKHFKVITRYHCFIFFILLSSKIPVFWHVLNLIFLSPPMDYYCNGTIISNATKNVCPCENPVWDRSVFTETMQSKFGILCESNWLVSFSQSIHFVGMLLGALIFGFLSDKFGRLPVFSLSCLILAIFGCLVSAMPTAASFILMRCFEGVGAGAAIVIGYVLCIEYCSVRHREIITVLFHLPIKIGHVTLPGVSYLLRHCDEFQMTISLPIFLYVGAQWLLMESPKWLLDVGHIDKAVDVMETFDRFNGRKCENIRGEIESYIAGQSDGSRTRIKFWQIFKHKKLTLNLCCMAVIYFLCGISYYGVSQYIGNMSKNIHANVALSGALLLPGTIVELFLLKLLPRRLFLMGTNFLSGLFMLIVICIPVHLTWFRVVIACICNCFFFMSFIIVFLYSVELFPTSIRNSVLGFLSVISRIGQIVAPQVNVLSESASGIIYGVMAIFGTMVCYFLPETKNTELPSSLNDSKSLSRKKKLDKEKNNEMTNRTTPDAIQINSRDNINESAL
ncbi:organic anion transporter 3-like [Epargyreus clarus]|uniref:organic anion transporter 3-like n=1 Tax=Epargyreus clarus TaxID=520877 RepID=UPI003C2EEA9F